jgi:hypothetical protein
MPAAESWWVLWVKITRMENERGARKAAFPFTHTLKAKGVDVKEISGLSLSFIVAASVDGNAKRAKVLPNRMFLVWQGLALSVSKPVKQGKAGQ